MKEKQDDNNLNDVDYSLKFFKNFFIYSLLFSGFGYGIYFSLKTIYPTKLMMGNNEIPCIDNDYKIHYKFPFSLEINPLKIVTCIPLSRPLSLSPFTVSLDKPKMEAKIPISIKFSLLKKIISISMYLGLTHQDIEVKESEIDLESIKEYIDIPIGIKGLIKGMLSLGVKSKELNNFSMKLSSNNFVIEEQVYSHDQFGNIEIPLLDFKKLDLEVSLENKVLLFKKFTLGNEFPKLEVTGNIKMNSQNVQASQLDVNVTIKLDKALKEKFNFLSLIAPNGEKEDGFSFKVTGSLSDLKFE